MLRWWGWITVIAMGCLAGSNAPAVSRFGAPSDDSVCDVGDAAKRASGVMSADAFVKTKCRNGQMLMGTSAVPVGSSLSDIALLAMKSCAAATIESSRVTEVLGGVSVDVERIRCPISKLTL